MTERPAFRYLREPMFVGAAACYVANTVWWKPVTVDRASIVHCYLGDVLCMPVLLPLVLWLQRRTGLRDGGVRPSVAEVFWHWLLWSCCFEWLGPRLPLLAPGAVGDPVDVLAYAVGGFAGALAWCGRSSCASSGTTTLRMRLLQGMLALATALAVLSVYRIVALLR